MSIPTEPGLYEAAHYPLSEGYNGYLLATNGLWYEIHSDATLFQYDDIQMISPMTSLVPEKKDLTT